MKSESKKPLERLKEWALGISGYNEKGEELPDPVPLEPPLDFEAPIPLAEELRRLAYGAAHQMALRDAGVESFEDADDFDIPDDPADPEAPWESEHIGKVWTREAELRSGVVAHPDYEAAKELRSKADRFIKDWEEKNKKTPPTGGK